MPSNKQSEPKENPWYPRHVSDRVDELLDEIDEAQCQCLFDELKKTDMNDWFTWLETARNEIAEYDTLSRVQRRRRLSEYSSVNVLKFHHACIFVELWRIRTGTYFTLPPAGVSLDTGTRQREMMLAVMSAYSNFDLRDLWPFDFPHDAYIVPFQMS